VITVRSIDGLSPRLNRLPCIVFGEHAGTGRAALRDGSIVIANGERRIERADGSPGRQISIAEDRIPMQFVEWIGR